MTKKNRAINKKLNTLEEKIEGYERVTYDEIWNKKILVCGYLRLPHTNHKGIIQGYCSLKKSNCLKFKNYKIGENCTTYQKYLKK